METNKISKKLRQRLPLYLDYLKSLPDDVENISATMIARALGLGDVQVRKDLAMISHAGRRRTGRDRRYLEQDIEAAMGFGKDMGTIVIGAGKLGQTLLDYAEFENSGINLLAGFDISPRAEQTLGGKPIYPMRSLGHFCRCYDVRVGIIAVPAESAQVVCDQLIDNGIRAIWNFAPIHLEVPERVIVQNENLAVSLSSLRLQMQENTGF